MLLAYSVGNMYVHVCLPNSCTSHQGVQAKVFDVLFKLLAVNHLLLLQESSEMGHANDATTHGQLCHGTRVLVAHAA